ncbi:hypothetical protein DevBK_16905 [Devosia sp. BK]|uniref:hypothetical protein n=1 Tax=Devosia sp. BK TaxID=2871706 RepID=UPI002939B49B|nr:hypothetical protein [Devosia sp. BK]MDV3253021.1 hypothetical protein [Devosia sp. BK]
MSIEDPNANGAAGASPELKNQVADDLNQAVSRAGDDLEAVTQRAAHDAKNLGHMAEEKVSEVAGKAKSFATDQKDLAADQINGIAAAISKVAGELENSDQQTVARYARDLANGLTRVGDRVQTSDVDELMGSAQDFGRTQPVAFLGAAALVGFVASRFAMASAQRREAGRQTQPKREPVSPTTAYDAQTTRDQGGF